MSFTPYLIVSAEKAGLDPVINLQRTETLRHQLAPLHPIALTGRYEGAPERSFLVAAAEDSDTATTVERLAWNWEQESVLYIDSSKHATLVFADGSRQALGLMQEVDRCADIPSYIELPDGRRIAA